MKVLHTADLHISKNPDKLEEVIRTSDYILTVAEQEGPDVIIVAGDTVDEYDGAIRLDSETARAAISFVTRAANIAPVVIIRGTKSHDRETPYIFKHLHTRYPVHVTSDIEQVALVEYPFAQLQFMDFLEAFAIDDANIKFAFTLVPSVDKAYIMGHMYGSIREGNMQTRELLHDLFAGFGIVNESIQNVPRVMVSHGMVTGAQFSSGQTAVGEDLEYGVNDLQAAKCDYVALGHVHKFQSFPGNICYSGSPGRLNFGEQEEKGFLMVEFDGQAVKEIKFHPTPARRFGLYAMEWADGGRDKIMAELAKAETECAGADVRFRYSIPEENKHEVDRAEIERRIMAAGARRCKVEPITIPKIRQRAANISKITTIPGKVTVWGETVGEEIPEGVLKIASVIEGHEVDELLADSLKRIEGEMSADAVEQIVHDLGSTHLSNAAALFFAHNTAIASSGQPSVEDAERISTAASKRIDDPQPDLFGEVA